jgi:hypothetical protein
MVMGSKLTRVGNIYIAYDCKYVTRTVVVDIIAVNSVVVFSFFIKN